jgi:radical SAM protein with 4Fe4S-binding SPASM domain
MQVKVDKHNRFVSTFDMKTGFYVRTGVIDKRGKDTGVDPFMCSFPELIDIGIMGSCEHGSKGLCLAGGVQCYQNGFGKHEPNMTLDNFKRIIDECKGKVYQVALGGRGDVDQHENFEEIMQYCRDNSIVPNFTSSGLGFTDEIVDICKQYSGAVAISWYRSEYTLRAIQMLLDAGVKTNIHYVLSNSTLDEAIERLVNNTFPKGINAIIFLLHKPVGLGKENNVLRVDNPKVKTFFELVDNSTFPFKVGFDSCSIPALVNFAKNLDTNSFDTCEAGRWSAYVTSDMKLLPCSFDNQQMRWAFDLNTGTIQEGWYSPQFENFRDHFRKSCLLCEDRLSCMSGCPIVNQITLCNRKERTYENSK